MTMLKFGKEHDLWATDKQAAIQSVPSRDMMMLNNKNAEANHVEYFTSSLACS